MCGYCFEGYYLSGWQNGNYDAGRIDSKGLVLGEDGFVAMGLVEYTGGDESQARELMNRFPEFALTPWVIMKIHQQSPLSDDAVRWVDAAYARQAVVRQLPESYWYSHKDDYPRLNSFYHYARMGNWASLVTLQLLDEAERFLLDIFSHCTYEIKEGKPEGETETEMFILPSLYRNKLSDVFKAAPLEVFLATELLIQFRSESWVLPMTISVDVEVFFISYFPGWRRIVANHVFGNESSDIIETIGNILPLNTLKGLFLRHQNDKQRVSLLTHFVESRVSDDQVNPAELLAEMKNSAIF